MEVTPEPYPTSLPRLYHHQQALDRVVESPAIIKATTAARDRSQL